MTCGCCGAELGAEHADNADHCPLCAVEERTFQEGYPDEL